MTQGLLWFPLLLFFVLLVALGWLERRRQTLFREWAVSSELAKLDGCGAARLKDGWLHWCGFEAGHFQEKGTFEISRLELVELMALTSGEAPLVPESQGRCRLRLIGEGQEMEVPFADAEQARRWMEQLMAKARCDL
ncbi:putative secreted or membrane protein [cyanobiont of Ornithocercus magnificus]|nr:putative secreted or membrane protein [cyanobiont of Ornithocercus magnificus]